MSSRDPRPQFPRIVARNPARADVRAAAWRGVVYLLLGDLKEAVILFLFACTSVGIAVVQEARTERVLESLRDLTSPRALVIRDGIETRIAGAEVVRGDVIILAEGDRVPADATVLVAHDLNDRRVAAHGRVGAGAQGRRAQAHAVRPSWRRRSSLCLFRQPDRPRPWARRGDRNRLAQRDRQNRRGDHRHRDRAATASGRDRTARPPLRRRSASASAPLRCCSTDSCAAAGSTRC